ncbi:MAG: nascent polypeptide-associated complex protein [Thermoplasmata archaeon]|nr:nascent polypeptide-associated complex protein [Thermoplasmata archaeon]
MLPGGAMNPRQMQLMMRKLGMTSEPIDQVEEVIVRTRENEHVFQRPEVTVITMQGVRTYQVVGNPQIRKRGAAPPPSAASAAATGTPTAPSGPPEEDIELVMSQAEVDRDEALAALREVDGAPAEAILKILSRRSAGEG